MATQPPSEEGRVVPEGIVQHFVLQQTQVAAATQTNPAQPTRQEALLHWGDETVRPQAQVNDFVLDAKAAGKGFGLGLYDGVTCLVTQPWIGAQK